MNNIFGQAVNPLSHPYADIFLLGFIAALSLIAALFFLRFWWATRDKLFISFVIFFVVQGCSDAMILSYKHPNMGHPWLYLVRLLSIIWVLAAILAKNYSRS
ncbi:MAG TPA: DUF5985 family protein [Acidobacteriaceae bacterium]|nr:DUF5985 family protein [Acidobacteriaceae bacterium]